MTHKKKKVLTTIGIFIIVLIVFALGIKFFLVDPRPFTSRVVKIYDDVPTDGCKGFELENNTNIVEICFWTYSQFKGKVIGNPQVGDVVEVKANREDGFYYRYLYDEGTYIKKK